jgi:hypothetical protein
MILQFLLLVVATTLAQLYIHSPESLRQKFESRYIGGEIPHNTTYHGDLNAGQSLISNLYYSPRNKNGCSIIDIKMRNKIVLFDDKGCTVLRKTNNAFQANARGVIIAQDLPGPDVFHGSTTFTEIEPTIPWVQTNVSFAEILAVIDSGIDVSILLHSNTTHPVGKRSVTVWMSFDTERQTKTLTKLIPTFLELSEFVEFEPRVMTWSMSLEGENKDWVATGKICGPGVYTGKPSG